VAVAGVVVASIVATWFLIPHTPPGPVNSGISTVGFRYFGATLVGFFELLAYGTVKNSLRIVLLGTAIGTIGAIMLLS
jgi:hypothetical protein